MGEKLEEARRGYNRRMKVKEEQLKKRKAQETPVDYQPAPFDLNDWEDSFAFGDSASPVQEKKKKKKKKRKKKRKNTQERPTVPEVEEPPEPEEVVEEAE